ncbi:hypothetical protein [Streptomyces sp. NPDC060035]|uniref:hypothetical protein n=1 Tax=Streptomyces sp. NPDC060035 TaxID=3347044 RepID=UPI0036A3B9B7
MDALAAAVLAGASPDEPAREDAPYAYPAAHRHDAGTSLGAGHRAWGHETGFGRPAH